MTQSYVAAHLVHFASVAALLLAFERAHLAQAPDKSAAVVLVGLVIVLTAGITAGGPSRLSNGINTVAMYAIFAIFMLAFVHNPVKPLRIMAVLLGAALVLRLTARLPNARAADVSEQAPSRTSEPN